MKVYIGPYPDEGEQEIDVQIDKWDTWSMDHTLAYIIVPMLNQLKETMHGYPSELTAESWNEILDEMIWAFTYKRDNFNTLMDKDREAAQERMTNGFILFGKYYENLWD